MVSSLLVWDGIGLSASMTTAFYFLKNKAVARAGAATGPLATALLGVFARHGHCPHALVSLSPEAAAWQSGADGGVSYIERGAFWLASGEPIAAGADRVALARDFAAAAAARGRRAVFLPATEEFARQMRAEGWSCLKLGASPYFDLDTWNPRGNVARHLRSSVNKAVKAGVTVAQAEDIHSLRGELDGLCAGWLQTRPAGTSFGWLFALNPLGNAGYKKYFVARDGAGRIVGLLSASPMPAREGWYLEDVIRAPDSPAGVCDVLVYNVLRQLQAEGYKTATLGTVLLTDEGEDCSSEGDWTATRRNLKVARGVLAGFYNFEGLQHFKAKFVPSRWEAEYLVIPDAGNALLPLRITLAGFRAIMPGGLWPVIRYLIAGR